MGRARGFTLIEIMIALVVVALLVAVALPSFQEQIRKSRRAEGKAALLKAIQLQERFYTANATYAGPTQLPGLFGLAGGPVRSGENPADANGWYALTVGGGATCSPLTVCVVMVATPRIADPDCGQLILNSRGERTQTGTRDVRYCWN